MKQLFKNGEYFDLYKDQKPNRGRQFFVDIAFRHICEFVFEGKL